MTNELTPPRAQEGVLEKKAKRKRIVFQVTEDETAALENAEMLGQDERHPHVYKRVTSAENIRTEIFVIVCDEKEKEKPRHDLF